MVTKPGFSKERKEYQEVEAILRRRALLSLLAMALQSSLVAVEGVSLAYNVVQINRFRYMMSELYQIGNYVVFNASVRGYCTLQEYNLVQECQRQINDCQNQISKHGVMSVIDGFSLLMDIISASNRRYIQ